jgi:hypothetical protein
MKTVQDLINSVSTYNELCTVLENLPRQSNREKFDFVSHALHIQWYGDLIENFEKSINFVNRMVNEYHYQVKEINLLLSK